VTCEGGRSGRGIACVVGTPAGGVGRRGASARAPVSERGIADVAGLAVAPESSFGSVVVGIAPVCGSTFGRAVVGIAPVIGAFGSVVVGIAAVVGTPPGGVFGIGVVNDTVGRPDVFGTPWAGVRVEALAAVGSPAVGVRIDGIAGGLGIPLMAGGFGIALVGIFGTLLGGKGGSAVRVLGEAAAGCGIGALGD
jgi:hypothetical protein